MAGVGPSGVGPSELSRSLPPGQARVTSLTYGLDGIYTIEKVNVEKPYVVFFKEMIKRGWFSNEVTGHTKTYLPYEEVYDYSPGYNNPERQPRQIVTAARIGELVSDPFVKGKAASRVTLTSESPIYSFSKEKYIMSSDEIKDFYKFTHVESGKIHYVPVNAVRENENGDFPGLYASLPDEMKGGARRRKHRGTKKARKHRRYSRRR